MMFIKAWHLINKDKCVLATPMGSLCCENYFLCRMSLHPSLKALKHSRSILQTSYIKYYETSFILMTLKSFCISIHHSAEISCNSTISKTFLQYCSDINICFIFHSISTEKGLKPTLQASQTLYSLGKPARWYSKFRHVLPKLLT